MFVLVWWIFIWTTILWAFLVTQTEPLPKNACSTLWVTLSIHCSRFDSKVDPKLAWAPFDDLVRVRSLDIDTVYVYIYVYIALRSLCHLSMLRFGHITYNSVHTILMFVISFFTFLSPIRARLRPSQGNVVDLEMHKGIWHVQFCFFSLKVLAGRAFKDVRRARGWLLLVSSSSHARIKIRHPPGLILSLSLWAHSFL